MSSMKWDNDRIKTPLARARGLGASRSAVDGWIALRVTAIGNTLLAGWFIWFLQQNIGVSHLEFTTNLANPVNAVAMILFIISVFYHATLGCREIIEDYLHNEGFKIFKLLATYLFFFALAVACIFSVLKISFTANVEPVPFADVADIAEESGL